MISNSSGHRWRHPECTVNPNEIVVGGMQPQRPRQVLDAPAEGVRRSGESPQKSPAVKVIPLRVAGANIRQFGASRESGVVVLTVESRVGIHGFSTRWTASERILGDSEIIPAPCNSSLVVRNRLAQRSASWKLTSQVLRLHSCCGQPRLPGDYFTTKG